jgi:predicted ArsR family transcriptional regulator
MSRPSYELVMSIIERGARSSADVAALVECSEWAAARALQQLRERGFVELVRNEQSRLVWQRSTEEAVA